jgi:hypothetical protein
MVVSRVSPEVAGVFVINANLRRRKSKNPNMTMIFMIYMIIMISLLSFIAITKIKQIIVKKSNKS